MKKDINIEIGIRIKGKRNYFGYTREQLAEIVGISPQFLADIESGKKGMSFTTLIKLCSALSCSCDYIITGNESSTSTDRLAPIIENLSENQIDAAEDLLKAFVKAISKH